TPDDAADKSADQRTDEIGYDFPEHAHRGLCDPVGQRIGDDVAGAIGEGGHQNVEDDTGDDLCDDHARRHLYAMVGLGGLCVVHNQRLCAIAAILKLDSGVNGEVQVKIDPGAGGDLRVGDLYLQLAGRERSREIARLNGWRVTAEIGHGQRGVVGE